MNPRALTANEWAEALKVPCPYCKAKADKACVTRSTRQPIAGVHPERVVAAAKAEEVAA